AGQSVMNLDLRRAGIRLGPCTGAKLDQRVGFFRTGCYDAARAVILERPTNQPHAVGQQGRCERISGKARVTLAVEAEGDRPAAVDATTGVQAIGLAHRGLVSAVTSGLGSPIL